MGRYNSKKDLIDSLMDKSKISSANAAQKEYAKAEMVYNSYEHIKLIADCTIQNQIASNKTFIVSLITMFIALASLIIGLIHI